MIKKVQMTKISHINFGQLKHIRKLRQLSALEVCDKLKITKSTLYRYESGETKIPEDILDEIVKIYEIPKDSVLIKS